MNTFFNIPDDSEEDEIYLDSAALKVMAGVITMPAVIFFCLWIFYVDIPEARSITMEPFIVSPLIIANIESSSQIGSAN